MLRNLLKQYRSEYAEAPASEQGSFGLQIALWTALTISVAVVGYINWHGDVSAQRPVNTLGLVIHCALAGLIGMVVMIKIEMWLEPWRFMD